MKRYEIYLNGTGASNVPGIGEVERGKWIALTNEQVASFENAIGGKLENSGLKHRVSGERKTVPKPKSKVAPKGGNK